MLLYCSHCYFRQFLSCALPYSRHNLHYGVVTAELSFVSHTVQFGKTAPACLWSSTSWCFAVHQHQNTMLMFWPTELQCTCAAIVTEINILQGRNKAGSFSCTAIAAQKIGVWLLQAINTTPSHTSEARPFLVGKGRAIPVLAYCFIHWTKCSDREYLRCCPIRGGPGSYFIV